MGKRRGERKTDPKLFLFYTPRSRPTPTAYKGRERKEKGKIMRKERKQQRKRRKAVSKRRDEQQ